jgi:uncharacterized membrane protein
MFGLRQCSSHLHFLHIYLNTLIEIHIMDFAPYQDTSPETTRALSPPPVDRSASFSPRLRSPAPLSPRLQAPPNASPWAPISGSSTQGFGNGNNLESGRGRLDEFETSLPIRLDYEACLAYLLLPPAGGVLLLMLEHKSDYVRYELPSISTSTVCFGLPSWHDLKIQVETVLTTMLHRFHAWQSSLLFSAIFVLHLIFAWSTVMSWLFFTVDMVLIAFLTFRAYKDGTSNLRWRPYLPFSSHLIVICLIKTTADTLDRCEVPFFGPLASKILDDE